jgi:hypothetical protein
LPKLEKYDLIINFISDVGYDHFDAKKKVENSEFRLQGIMSLFIKDVIEKESNKIRENLKKKATGSRN